MKVVLSRYVCCVLGASFVDDLDGEVIISLDGSITVRMFLLSNVLVVTNRRTYQQNFKYFNVQTSNLKCEMDPPVL